MKFQYSMTVTAPPSHAGHEGEIKDVEPWIVRQLVADGYGVALEDYPEVPEPEPASPYPEQEEAAPVVVVDEIEEPLDEGGDAESSDE